jgi:hypothetical protein
MYLSIDQLSQAIAEEPWDLSLTIGGVEYQVAQLTPADLAALANLNMMPRDRQLTVVASLFVSGGDLSRPPQADPHGVPLPVPAIPVESWAVEQVSGALAAIAAYQGQRLKKKAAKVRDAAIAAIQSQSQKGQSASPGSGNSSKPS